MISAQDFPANAPGTMRGNARSLDRLRETRMRLTYGNQWLEKREELPPNHVDPNTTTNLSVRMVSTKLKQI